MESALVFDRLQFAFTVMFHYLFPQLTMGLAPLIVYLRTRALRAPNGHYDRAARFWTKLFAVNFAFGVVTGIPLEFQFGTNWARFSNFAGGVIGQTLAMEGVFAFFLESFFLGVLLFGAGRFEPKVQWFAALMVFLGTWLSGYFILVTNAWMQHPVAYSVGAGGSLQLESLWGLLTNPWIAWQYAHTMIATLATAGFVMAAAGAYYLLSEKQVDFGRTFARIGVVSAAIACALLAFPTGDGEAKQVFTHQPIKGAAMEGLFHTERGAGLVLIGQPNLDTMTLDNPLIGPDFLSVLTYRRWNAEMRGLDTFPRKDWPDNVSLLYYAYHIMVGLGTILLGIATVAVLLLWGGRLFRAHWLLWILMFSFPFPYIATTAGWMTTELGRQPWVAYGLMRTGAGASPLVGSGSVLFTLLGFLGLYALLGLLFFFLVMEMIWHGPSRAEPARPNDQGMAKNTLI
jgi:cytochrome bd ubiquinol oxidase subunit I